MVKDSVTIQETVDFLNSLLEVDRHAVTALFSLRIGCNKKLLDHESVQCGIFDLLTNKNEYCQVGMIGVFNGLFGADEHGWGHIVGDYEDGIITAFRLLTDDDAKRYIQLNNKDKE